LIYFVVVVIVADVGIISI